MIKFKNINGDVFLAVGSIKRKSALNGEKSLTGTLFEGDDVLNKIDKGWSLEFDNEPYVVNYFERNDNDNTVEFDAIHKFFWDMTKDVLYFSWSGSHTAKAYLEQIFKDTGYQYALNFEPSAFEKDNWGMKNKLSLFNDVIDSMGGEFEINGTLVSIFKNVGSDLSTIVRHGFNLSDMSLENDNTDFVTYGEGFGGYADQENQTGERLHVTYTSPLAKTFGKLHAEPIDDQRYTIKDNLLQAIKDKVDGSFAISIKLSLYDLTAAGYPYKMANVGDWLLAIDENLDFKQKIRIISVDDEFATDGTRISYTVTCGDIGVVQKYQQANASLGQKVDSAYHNAQDAKESSIQAVIAANGKNTTRWFDSKEEMDAFKANEGDMAFLRTGDGEAMYIYTKMPDGSFKWVKRVDPDTGEQIAAGVDDAIKQAKSQAAAMDEVRASESAVFQSEANAALSSAAAERTVFSSNAASMATSAATHADSMANSAAAYGKAQAASALSSANSALTTAKSDLTTAIRKETEGRNKAVQTVNSQAQDYADQAKSDAISAASSADGAIRTAINSSADSLSATITQNKSSADSGISTAQTTAKAAVDGLAFKVSKTDYDQKTGDLSTKINDVKDTADKSAQTIADIQEADGKQDTRMAEIEKTAGGIKSTVSDLSTAQGKQSGYISELQQRADGFEATVTKVDSLGQINQLFNTEFTPDLEGWSASNSDITYAGISKTATVSGSNVFYITHSANTNWAAYRQQIIDFVVGGTLSASVYARQTAGNWFFTIDSYDSNGTRTIIKQVNITTSNTLLKIENVTIPSDASKLYFSFWGNTAGTAVIYKPMLVFDSTVGNYVQGNYNNNGSLAKVKLTADKATLDLSNYQKDADGRISKAQADITATTNEVKTKVSQSDYNAKTDDLTTKYGQVKATADDVTTEVSEYKKLNDGKVSANAANIKTLNDQITSKVSQTVFDETTGDLNGKYTETKQTVDKISNTVSELQAKANAQGQINQLVNTEFSPDLQGWDSGETSSGVKTPYRQYIYQGSNMLTFDARNQADKKYSSIKQTIPFATSGSNRVVSLSWWSRIAEGTGLYGSTHIRSYDANMVKLTDVAQNWDSSSSMTLQKFENAAIPDEAQFVEVTFAVREGYLAFLAKPMLVFDKTVGTYVQGNYNNNSRVSALEVDLDGITGLVNDPKKGLSATATLAANGLSVATKAQNEATTATQTAKGVQTKVEQMGSINQLVNTEFSPDLEGWEDGSDASSPKPYIAGVDLNVNARLIGFKTGNTANNTYARLLQWVSTGSDTPKISLSWMSFASSDITGKANIYLGFADSNDKVISSAQHTWIKPGVGWDTYKWENISLPSGTRKIKVSFEATGGVTAAYLAHPMLVFGETIGDYVQGNYNNNNSLESTRTQLAGQITDEIEDRKSGDSSVVTQTTRLIDQRVESVTEGYESAISQSADKIMASVSMPNQLINTEFTPDLQGWLASNNFIASASLDKSATMHGSNVLNIVHSANTNWAAYRQQIIDFVTGGTLSASVYAKSTAGNWSFVIDSYNSSGTRTIVKSVNVPTSNTLLKFENITIPSDTSELYFSFWGQTAGTLAVSQPMLVFSDTLSTYMVGSASNSSTVLSLFRDHWDIGLADNIGKITSGIIGDNNSMALISNNIILSGKTTVTDDFYAKGGNFQNLNASNLKTGTLNAENVNVININASNLAGGTIRGINIEAADINLVNDNSQIHGNYDWGDSDEAIFPRHYVGNWTLGKRRLQYYGDVTPNDSTNDGGKYSAYTYYGLDSIKMRRLFATGNLNRTVDIDAGKGELYIRKRDNEQQNMNANITVVEAGKAQFRGDNSRLVVSTNKVLDATNIVNTVQLKAGNDDETSSVQGYHIRGKRFSPPTGYDDNVWMYFYPSGDDTYYGLGLLRGDTVARGYLSSTWAYSNTYSYPSNMYVTSNGNIGRTTSASKYKLAITHYDELDRANKLLNIDPARWFDKAETEEYADELSGIKDSVEKLPVKPHFGLIAEDLVDAGLEEFVSYDTNTGEVEGLEYDRVWTVLIPLIRDMKKRIEELESEK